MSELPKSWVETTLGAVGDYLNGRGFRKAEWRESGRPIVRIQNLTGTSNSFNYFDGVAEESYVARRGDLLVSWAATLGVFVWPGPEAVVNQHIFKVESHIDRGFHRYLIASVLNDLQRQTHGSGMVHITRSRFDSTPVALPPLAEQRRIVAAIEEHFSRLDAAEESLRRAQRRLVQLKKATISDAIRGDWPNVHLGDVTESQTYGSNARASSDPSGVPILRMGNIQDGKIDFRELKYLPTTHPDIAKCDVRAGDLLFNRTNSPELVGKSAVFRTGPKLVACASYLIRVRLTPECEPEWAALVVNGPTGREYVARVRTQQVGQANVNGTKLAAMPIPLPPLADQHRIVAEVERRLSLVDALAAATAAALKRSAALRRSILERAFTGKLVPQDPRDEPASVLLERIKAEREARV